MGCHLEKPFIILQNCPAGKIGTPYQQGVIVSMIKHVSFGVKAISGSDPHIEVGNLAELLKNPWTIET